MAQLDAFLCKTYWCRNGVCQRMYEQLFTLIDMEVEEAGGADMWRATASRSLRDLRSAVRYYADAHMNGLRDVIAHGHIVDFHDLFGTDQRMHVGTFAKLFARGDAEMSKDDVVTIVLFYQALEDGMTKLVRKAFNDNQKTLFRREETINERIRARAKEEELELAEWLDAYADTFM